VSGGWPGPGVLEGGLLHALRFLPLAVTSPILGGPLAPPVVRMGLGAGVGLLAWALAGAPPAAAGGLLLVGPVARELALGAALAVVAAAPLDAARAAGRLADTLRGATLAELHVAPVRQRETALGDLLVQLTVALASAAGAGRLLVASVAGSFQALPAGAPLGAEPLVELALRCASSVFVTAVAIAAPAAAGVLAADLAVAAMARVAAGLQLPELAQPARASLGLAAVAAAAAAAAGRLVELAALTGRWPAFLAPGVPP